MFSLFLFLRLLPKQHKEASDDLEHEKQWLKTKIIHMIYTLRKMDNVGAQRS